MVRSQQMLVVVVVATLGGAAVEATAGQRAQTVAADEVLATRTAAVPAGRIVGAVADAAGRPLEGAMVSAFGPSGAELAVSDRTGRFLLGSLAPGGYLVQAHLSGFVASPRELIEVTAQTPSPHTITLSRVGPVVCPGWRAGGPRRDGRGARQHRGCGAPRSQPKGVATASGPAERAQNG